MSLTASRIRASRDNARQAFWERALLSLLPVSSRRTSAPLLHRASNAPAAAKAAAVPDRTLEVA
jgi:hypothetical protein